MKSYVKNSLEHFTKVCGWKYPPMDMLGTLFCGHFALYFHIPIFPICQVDSLEQELCIKYLSITMLAIESDTFWEWTDGRMFNFIAVLKGCPVLTTLLSFFSKDGESSDPK